MEQRTCLVVPRAFCNLDPNMPRKSNLGRLALTLLAIVSSHVPYALGWYPQWHFVYLPLPVIAICLVLVPQRRASWLIAASIATFAVSACAQGNWQMASIDILWNALAVAALGWVYGFRQSIDQRQAKGWIRLTRRLRRQSTGGRPARRGCGRRTPPAP